MGVVTSVAALRLPVRVDMVRDPPRKHHIVEYSDTVHAVDDLFYLRDKSDSDTVLQIEAERIHAVAKLGGTAPLRDELAQSVLSFATSAAGPWRRHGAYEWRQGSGAYPTWERRRPGGEPETVLDTSVAPCEVPSQFEGGIPYRTTVKGVSHVAPSPSGELVAYTVDATGDEIYSVEVTDGRQRSPLSVGGVDAVVAWGASDDELYVLRRDDAGRPHELWRRVLDDDVREELVFAEQDERFRIEPPKRASDGGSSLVLIDSRNATEVRRASDGELVLPRRPGRRLTGIDAAGDRLYATLESPALLVVEGDEETSYAPHNAATLEGVRALSASRVVVWGAASNGRSCAWLADTANFDFEELKLPVGVTDVEVRDDILDDDPSRCVVEVWSPTRFPALASLGDDGVIVGPAATPFEESLTYELLESPPTILVSRKEAPLDAVVLRAYGAYGARQPTALEPATAALLQRGVRVALVSARGGGERGRAWREAGRGAENKHNTASDVLKAARNLGKRGFAVGAWARSAGGLGVGGAVHLDPEAFSAVALDVPFLDALGTLADPTLPLTVNEWEEFGDPRRDYEAVRNYSPASNVRPGAAYPPMLLRPAFHDARTGWWESYKFAARVRAAAAAADVLVLADDRGHFAPSPAAPAGASDVAQNLAFLVHHLQQPRGRDESGQTQFATYVDSQALPDWLATQGAELKTATFSSHLVSDGSIYLQNRMYQDELQASVCSVFATSDDRVVAVASAHRLFHHPRGEAWYVSGVAVDPAWRRRGLAMGAVAALESAAKKANVPYLILHVGRDNTPARDLYMKKLDYEPAAINTRLDVELRSFVASEEQDVLQKEIKLS